MKMKVEEKFRDICAQILAMQKSEEEWAEEESSDMFQTESFSGGYDADEHAFCFSYYDEGRNEFWFQLTLSEISEVAEGTKEFLDVRPAE